MKYFKFKKWNSTFLFFQPFVLISGIIFFFLFEYIAQIVHELRIIIFTLSIIHVIIKNMLRIIIIEIIQLALIFFYSFNFSWISKDKNMKNRTIERKKCETRFYIRVHRGKKVSRDSTGRQREPPVVCAHWPRRRELMTHSLLHRIHNIFQPSKTHQYTATHYRGKTCAFHSSSSFSHSL